MKIAENVDVTNTALSTQLQIDLPDCNCDQESDLENSSKTLNESSDGISYYETVKHCDLSITLTRIRTESCMPSLCEDKSQQDADGPTVEANSSNGQPSEFVLLTVKSSMQNQNFQSGANQSQSCGYERINHCDIPIGIAQKRLIIINSYHKPKNLILRIQKYRYYRVVMSTSVNHIDYTDWCM